MIVSGLGAALLVVRLIAEFISLHLWGFQISSKNPGYNVVIALLTPFAITGIGYLIFLTWRMGTFERPYKRLAIKSPRELVQTAGTIFGTIVGRDDLCRAIMEELRDPRTRRPHVIIGGVGAGKTAMLVRLTELLAQKGAIPIPLRLRDYERSLDFRGAAHERFVELSQLFRLSGTQADKIWQQLCKDNKIVVLADGLEEALQELGKHDNERDNMIRVAIHRAHKERLPLIIASRPHAPLNGMEASMTQLEALNERIVLEHLCRTTLEGDHDCLQWIVETAEVSESPLFLQITSDLSKAKLLDRVDPRRATDWVDTGSHDRTGLQIRLLDTWLYGLIEGYLYEDIALDDKDRKATIEQLSALACAGLLMDSLYVRFSEFLQPEDDVREVIDDEEKRRRKLRRDTNEQRYEPINEALDKRVSELQRRVNLQLAATYGQELGLVEPFGDGIRFPHSIMQAYLGSRYVGVAVKNREYVNTALAEPGREFLMAVVIHSRETRAGKTLEAPRASPETLVGLLREAATNRSVDHQLTKPVDRDRAHSVDRTIKQLDAKTVELYTNAVQIVPETPQDGLAPIAKAVGELLAMSEHTPQRVIGDTLALQDAKLEFVHRLGESMRLVEGRHRLDAGGEERTLGSEVRETDIEVISRGDGEPSYTVGVALHRVMSRPRKDIADECEAWKDDIRRAYCELFDLGVSESSYAVRLAAAQEIGLGGNLAYEALEERSLLQPPRKALGKARGEQQQRRACEDPEQAEERQLRGDVLRAWLAPLLVSSVTHTERCDGVGVGRKARTNLEEWLDYVALDGGDELGHYADSTQRFRLNLGIALAQGFRHAANRRRPHTGLGSRAHLAERAKYMLHTVDFWYARIALLHSLTLWSLPDGTGELRNRGKPQSSGAVVKEWMVMRREEAERVTKSALVEHPFVAQAANLCALALESGQPERFIWIDESGVLSKTGSGPAATTTVPRHDVWIPRSTGWSALDPRTQQLVADVLILLNLIEGGCGANDRERRLVTTDVPLLPPCLTKDRRLLDLERTVGVMHRPDLQSGCSCAFGLCPYPRKGQDRQRAELSESFCRRQRVILRCRRRLRSFRWRTTAPWQGETKSHLKSFWDEMGKRSRG